MFVVKGGTKKEQTVWQMNVPQNLYGLIAQFATIRRKQRFIKIHWRFVSRCIARNAKKEMRVDIIRRKIYPCTKVYK